MVENGLISPKVRRTLFLLDFHQMKDVSVTDTQTSIYRVVQNNILAEIKKCEFCLTLLTIRRKGKLCSKCYYRMIHKRKRFNERKIKIKKFLMILTCE